jgi:glyoxylase I family protein
MTPGGAGGRQHVTGIGGVFFAARDADALQRWYVEHLGLDGPPPSYDDRERQQDAGPTVFAAFGPEHRDSPHLGPRGFGVNVRVRDLDAMVTQLRSAGGRFASLHDPEGNPVQLWQLS